MGPVSWEGLVELSSDAMAGEEYTQEQWVAAENLYKDQVAANDAETVEALCHLPNGTAKLYKSVLAKAYAKLSSVKEASGATKSDDVSLWNSLIAFLKDKRPAGAAYDIVDAE